MLCFILLILLILSQNLPVVLFDCMDAAKVTPYSLFGPLRFSNRL